MNYLGIWATNVRDNPSLWIRFMAATHRLYCKAYLKRLPVCRRVECREEAPPWSGYNDISVPAKCPMDISTSRVSCDVGASSTGGLLVVRAPSWPVSDNEIVDTTGAGDSFIAAFIYGATNGIGIGR